jgi:hypothetical protein
MIGKGMTVCIVAATLLTGTLYTQAQTTSAPYPREYRRWTMVKGRMPEGGFRYIYVNDIGRDGFAKLPFAEGTVLVDERVQSTKDANGVFQEGPTLHVGVMVKDKRCAETGGWCFNMFTGEDTTTGLTPDAQKNCFTQCHSKRTDTDSVFSKFRKP